MNTAPYTPDTWRKHISIPGDKLHSGSKVSRRQNQRQMETFATEDNVKNGVQMSSIVSYDERRAVAAENITYIDALVQFHFIFSIRIWIMDSTLKISNTIICVV